MTDKTLNDCKTVGRASARLVASCALGFLVLAGCQETGGVTTASAPSPAPEPSVVGGPSEPFPFPNSRVLSRPGDTTALVEVRSLSNAPENFGGLQAAAEQFCGGPAIVGLPVSTNRMGLNTIRQYLVQCQ